MGVQGRAAFIDATKQILATSGPEALTIAALCDVLSVTKGSFYHHIGSMPELSECFAEAWELEFWLRFSAAEETPDPVRQLEIMAAHAIDVITPLHAAVRTWSWSNSAVGAATARVDAAGEKIVFDALHQLLDDPQRARMLARMGTSLVIGLQYRDHPTDTRLCAQAFLEWLSVSVGLDVYVEETPDGLVPRLSRRPQ